MPSVELRASSVADVENAVGFYVAEADKDVAERFVVELERSLRRLEQHPEIGSLRFAFELDLPGVRSLSVESFPYVIFYLVRREHLDVVRILYASRDIPSMLRDL